MSAVNVWLALMRVHEGGVAIRDGEYLNHGQPVAHYLAATLDVAICPDRGGTITTRVVIRSSG